jgi:hypothetical protein
MSCVLLSFVLFPSSATITMACVNQDTKGIALRSHFVRNVLLRVDVACIQCSALCEKDQMFDKDWQCIKFMCDQCHYATSQHKKCAKCPKLCYRSQSTAQQWRKKKQIVCAKCSPSMIANCCVLTTNCSTTYSPRRPSL